MPVRIFRHRLFFASTVKVHHVYFLPHFLREKEPEILFRANSLPDKRSGDAYHRRIGLMNPWMNLELAWRGTSPRIYEQVVIAQYLKVILPAMERSEVVLPQY